MGEALDVRERLLFRELAEFAATVAHGSFDMNAPHGLIARYNELAEVRAGLSGHDPASSKPEGAHA